MNKMTYDQALAQMDNLLINQEIKITDLGLMGGYCIFG